MYSIQLPRYNTQKYLEYLGILPGFHFGRFVCWPRIPRIHIINQVQYPGIQIFWPFRTNTLLKGNLLSTYMYWPFWTSMYFFELPRYNTQKYLRIPEIHGYNTWVIYEIHRTSHSNSFQREQLLHTQIRQPFSQQNYPFESSMRTTTPSKTVIFSLKVVIVACSMYQSFKTSTPSQTEIFSLKAVIVTCSCSMY